MRTKIYYKNTASTWAARGTNYINKLINPLIKTICMSYEKLKNNSIFIRHYIMKI